MAEQGRARGRARGRGEGETPRSARPNDGRGSVLPRGGLAARGAGNVDVQSRLRRLQAHREDRLAALVTPLTRPPAVKNSRGKEGEPVQLIGNFFSMQGGPTWCLYEYHIDFDPDVDYASKRSALLSVHKDKIGESYLFNGANLITPTCLPEESKWYSQLDGDDTKFEIRVRRTGELSPYNDQSVRIFDIVMRRIQLALDLKQSKRDFFDPQQSMQMPNFGLTVWPGYSTTITKYENELLLNIDVVHRVMRTDTIYDQLRMIHQRAGNFRENACKELIGCVVLTKYNNKTHTIDDILWPPQNTPKATFTRRGVETSIADYMKSEYGIEIRDTGQPLLVTRPRKMARRLKEEGRVDKLVPELCFMTGMSDAQRSDFRLMREFGELTRLGPDRRLQSYCGFGRRLASSEAASRILSQWNLRLCPEPIKLSGRKLPPVALRLANDVTVLPDVRTAEWERDLRSTPVLAPANLQQWLLVFPQREKNVAVEFAESLRRAGSGMGIQVAEPLYYEVNSPRSDSYVNACRQGVSSRMIICLLARKDRQLYEAIKKCTLVDLGKPNQCVVIGTLKKGLMSVCTRVLQQLNSKLGGALWKVAIPLKTTMICGFDTYHDSSARGKSRGGFVATLNPEFTRYYSRSFEHEVRQELSHYMQPCLCEAIKVFRSHNGQLPSKILFYRDGVGDNQLRVVAETEVTQLRDVFAQFGPDYQPGFAVIVVQKRIRPRFLRPVGANRVENPLPGTIVDNTVTNPRCYDFYVVAQSVRQGTVTPTRYNVIHESTLLEPDHHHQLAFRLSHMYYNWPGAIRVVAPCHYAHKLAFLIGQHVHAETSRQLWDKLYYL